MGAVELVSSKVCPGCKINKSFDQYYLCNRTNNKTTYMCKVCTKKQSNEYRRLNKEKIKKYHDEYIKEYNERQKLKKKVNTRKRTCKFDNCTTVLSSYNNSSFCSVHIKDLE
jgi:uncharacterized protein (DUF1330 family)